MSKLQTAYFASGCFWCITPIFKAFGVDKVVAGYSGGDEINPTYQIVKAQKTNHRETVALYYDENKVSYQKLLEIFLANVDPFDKDGQFIDRGFSYSLAIFYVDDTQKQLAQKAIETMSKNTGKKVEISIEPFKNFYQAEEYHQDYYLKNPEAFDQELIASGRKKKEQSIKKHKAGILMPISALPSKYGIGCFGKSAREFADFLANSKQSYWQILPLSQTSYGDSPYQSVSIYAGNPYFIDLDILKEEGLLKAKELKQAINSDDKINYAWLFETRYLILRKAYRRFKVNEDYLKWLANNQWVNDYALFMTLKVKNNYACWASWPARFKDYHKALKYQNKYQKEIDFWKFVQYQFAKQWLSLKQYINNKGIEVIGDMPIYVAYDSVELWQDKKNFLLDKNYNPTVVAGCPPDYFSPTGQLWGNPIYNYKKQAKDGFSWWVKRITYNAAIYDIVRIDHFRGFAGYYQIPFGETTAINGQWCKGYGKKIFDAVKKEIPNSKIIAEDLGYIDKPVIDLMDYCGFAGMKVLQFAFDQYNSKYLPTMYQNDNCVVYTATHDCETAASWFEQISANRWEIFNSEVKREKNDSLTLTMIKLALNSIANIAIIPIADYLELKNQEGRINTPASASGNWQFRLKEKSINKKLSNKIRKLTIKAQRD